MVLRKEQEAAAGAHQACTIDVAQFLVGAIAIDVGRQDPFIAAQALDQFVEGSDALDFFNDDHVEVERSNKVGDCRRGILVLGEVFDVPGGDLEGLIGADAGHKIGARCRVDGLGIRRYVATVSRTDRRLAAGSAESDKESC